MYLLAGCYLVLYPSSHETLKSRSSTLSLASGQQTLNPPPSDIRIYEHKLIGGLGRLYKVHACAFAAPVTEISMSCRGILIRFNEWDIEHFFHPLTQKLSASLNPSALLHVLLSIFKSWFDFFRLSISHSWSIFCFPAGTLCFEHI